jgi:hypothetical protein
MAPSPAMDHIRYRYSVYMIVHCQRRKKDSGCSLFSDLKNLRLHENCMMMILAPFSGFRMDMQTMSVSISHSSFGVAVSHVVCLRTEEHVRRVTARPIVTDMANFHAIGNGAKLKFPGDTMRIAMAVIDPEFSIATSCGSQPRPTSIGAARTVDLSPELGFPKGREWGRIESHVEPPIRCATPPAIASSAGAFC